MTAAKVRGGGKENTRRNKPRSLGRVFIYFFIIIYLHFYSLRTRRTEGQRPARSLVQCYSNTRKRLIITKINNIFYNISYTFTAYVFIAIIITHITSSSSYNNSIYILYYK